MIRSFNDKLKAKQEDYQAKQQNLVEQAERDRIAREWELFDLEQEQIKQKTQQILAEEAIRKEQAYLKQKRIQDEKNRKRIEEFEAWRIDELEKAKLSKKIIREGKIADAERYIAQSKQKPKSKRIKGINEGAAINAPGTWNITWKTFSIHPDIINLPISEKVRLYKLAERQQIDRTNYYANLHSPQNSIGSGAPDIETVLTNTSVISENTTLSTSFTVNDPLTINGGVTLIVQGVLTVNAPITNNGTINALQGFIINAGNIDNTNGTLLVP